MMITLLNLIADKKGNGAVEYGLIAAVVGVSLVGGLQLLEGGLTGLLTNISTTLNPAP
ncbi:MAG: Flp family type IVb pilin [Alphaproteobacteria bacterium]|nr:Flp family type IVb pilin [Alphaproteobacteria bacterium]